MDPKIANSHYKKTTDVSASEKKPPELFFVITISSKILLCSYTLKHMYCGPQEDTDRYQ